MAAEVRSVTAKLGADVGGFVAGFSAAGRSVDGLNARIASMGGVSTKASGSVTKLYSELRKSEGARRALTELGTQLGRIGLVGGIALAGVTLAAANFEQAMSNVQAATHGSAREMALLSDAAIQAGQRTQFSATEAAGAIEALSKAGLSTADILAGGLDGALDLAAAGSLDVAQAAQIAATAMTQFGLAGDDITHIADLMAAAAGKAQGEVTDMGLALGYVGPVAAQMGVSIDETVGSIAELASQGILGERAGTALRGMLTSLTSPSKIAATEMENLGISLYDAQGNFVGLQGVAGQLHDTMANLTNAERDQALGRIFGNEQITAARILYAGGAEAVQKWTAAVNDEGYAAETAGIKMDNLKGSVEQLIGSLETALIGTGDSGLSPTREAVDLVTDLVNAYSDLPDWIKESALAAGVFVTVVGLGAFAVTRLITGIIATRANLVTLGTTFRGVGLSATGYIDNLLGVASAQERASLSAQQLAANQARARSTFLRGAGLAAGLALVTSGLADKTGLSNTASLALMGTIAGPWGAAIGGGIGLVLDLTRGNEELADAIERANTVAAESPLDFNARNEALASLQAQTEKTSAALQDQGVSLGHYLDAFKTGADFLSGPGDLFQDRRDQFDAASEATHAYLVETMALQQGIFELNRELGNAPPETLGTDLDSINAAAERVLPALQSAGYSIEEIQQLLLTHQGWDEAIAATESFIRAQDSVPGRTRSVLDAVSGLDDTMSTAAEGASALASALDALLSPQLNLQEATDAYTLSLKHLEDDLAKHTRALEGNTDGAIKNRAAIADRTKDMVAQLTAEADAGATAEELSRSLKTQRERLLDAADAAGLNRDKVADLLKEYGLTPHLVETLIRANTSDALAKLNEVKRFLAGLSDKTITVNVNTGAIGHIAEGAIFMAGGGLRRPAVSGRPIVWGEAGPEAYIPLANDSRRPRALELWKETGRHLGAVAMAAGNVSGSAGNVNGSGRGLDFERLIARLLRGDVAETLLSVADALDEVERSEQRLKAAREASKQAQRALNAVEDQSSELYKKRAAAARAADKDLEQAQRDLADATNEWRAAQDALMAQSQAITDAVTAQGAAFGGAGTSVTAQGFLAKLTGSVEDAEQFRKIIAKLRGKHLAQSVIDQLLEEGPTAEGLGLAQSLLQAGPNVIHQINRQQRELAESGAKLAGQAARAGHHGHGGHGGDIGTQIQRQGNVYIDHVNWGPRMADFDRHVRQSMEHALMIARGP